MAAINWAVTRSRGEMERRDGRREAQDPVESF